MLIWIKGYQYILRVGKRGKKQEYSVRECRIGAMAFEAGWKAAKRSLKRK